ncbi:hypothetical protein HF888_12350 [Bermanella marisrubri]|uniref:Uncharacterized protein n=1 Tax=Bermanella marisrubri TaxID=207949 RepID=Q1MZY6_9GAMM|nr:hypothetical protein [Bermanella marisrubri]EAT11577.1 hypothetical protein RED65_02864 [Oceanobacter sp. RED65] [Bermanella marisrubri]QIZ84961.1 hypothetical protein HF888_12350 [Bermanella marisrubri]
MSDSVLHQRIEDALKAIIPFAQQADEIIEALKAENKAKFTAIFPQDSIFQTTANRFLPYIEELDKDYQALPEDVNDPAFEPLLKDLVKKMELIQLILQEFHNARDYDDEEESSPTIEPDSDEKPTLH